MLRIGPTDENLQMQTLVCKLTVSIVSKLTDITRLRTKIKEIILFRFYQTAESPEGQTSRSMAMLSKLVKD